MQDSPLPMCRAFEETKDKERITIACNLIKLGVNTLEQIAKVTNLPIEKVMELAAQ